MEKIPTLFERDWDGDRSRVLPVVAEGCGWVLEGEGVATRKYDGTCLMYDGTAWYARREVKPGKQAPENFVPIVEDVQTGKVIGWEPVAQSPYAKFWQEAVSVPGAQWEPGTYELIGPKVQGNPEHAQTHQLLGHLGAERYIVPRSFEGIRETLAELDVEGFVFHHEDGRMAKIKRRDFGLRR